MIKLGYLEGYTSFNVPKFNNSAQRDNYFNSLTAYDIDAYYPPFYTNIIKLDIDDVPLTSPINFVILIHNGKYYYYFVDKINYKNESIYEIVINMDTILTYMYDYRVTQGLKTRESIKRWNGNEINRDYVRENVSEGIMEVSSFTYRNPNKYIIVTSSHNYIDAGRDSGHYIQNGTYYDFGYYVYVFPLPPFELSNIATIHMYCDSGLTDLGSVNPYKVVDQFIADPYTINMMLVESEYLDKIYGTSWNLVATYLSCTVTFSASISSDDIVRFNNNKICGFNVINLPIDNNFIFSDNLGFIKNISDRSLFDYHYIPQLIDENYIQLEYGDVNGFSSYPLHQSKSSVFNYYNNLDVTNGNDGYYILDSLTSNNKYNSYNISLGLTFDLITDPWLEYQAQNKGTLSTGLQLQAVNTLYSTIKGIGTNVVSGLYMGGRSELEFEAGNQGLSNMYATRKFQSSTNAATSLTDGLMQGLNIVANYQINRDNLQFSPDTVKGRANLYSMMFSKYKSPYLKKFMVTDIENCARKLEEYGYRVNKVINSPLGIYIYNLCKNRKYYNCVSAKVTQYLTYCLIPNEIINDINSRLENGLRFINMNNLPNNWKIPYIFEYDNVEEE